MNKNQIKLIAAGMALTVSGYTQAAGFGTKIKTAIDNFGNELVIVGGGLLFIAVIIVAFNKFFGGEIAKKYMYGTLFGGLILVFAREITDSILSLAS